MKPKDLSERKFGKLTAIRWTGKSIHAYGRIWLCKCDCGKYREVPVNLLTNGSISQCVDCAKLSQNENHQKMVRLIQARFRNQRRDKLRNVWRNMKNRCYNVKNKEYSRYGERGINVCQEWLNDFDTFYNWAVNNGYQDGLTIERIDVNKGYSPCNCRFVTPREQAYNKENTIYITFNGINLSVAEIAYEMGLNLGTFLYQLRVLASLKKQIAHSNS